MRHALLLPALFLGCAAAPAAAPSNAPPAAYTPPPLTQERVAALFQEVGTLRGLPPRATVPIYLLDENSFVLALRQLVTGNAQRGDHEAEDAFVRGFHLAPQSPNAAHSSSAREVLEEQVLAFYDADKHHIVARQAQPKTSREAEKQLGTLAHELEHALQDQHFPRADVESMSGMDEVLAYRAVLEGDAMLAMVAFQAAERGIPFSRAIRRLSDVVRTTPVDHFVQSERGTALRTALPMMRERLLFPYHAGAGLVADLYRAGGLSLVNTLFLQRPKSTAQVLHPEKYIAGDQPVPVKPPQLPARYRLLSSNTLGELQTRVVLSACIAPEAARNTAAGWAGDRYTLATRDDDVLTLLWTTAWDTEKDAAEFVQVLRQAPTCLGGGVEIAAAGKNVSVTRGLDDSIAKETTTSLLALVGDKPSQTPIGNFVIPMAASPLPPEKGVLWGQTYSNRWLGVTGLVPPGLSSQIGAQQSELRVSMPGFGVFGSFFVSDTMTVPRFVEELFQSIARGLDEEFGGRALVPIAGGPLALPLGPAIDRWWSIANTSMSVRAIIVPVCSGTGAYVFLQSWPDPAGKQMLDSWLYSFRWASPMTPPICEHLNPR